MLEVVRQRTSSNLRKGVCEKRSRRARFTAFSEAAFEDIMGLMMELTPSTGLLTSFFSPNPLRKVHFFLSTTGTICNTRVVLPSFVLRK